MKESKATGTSDVNVWRERGEKAAMPVSALPNLVAAVCPLLQLRSAL